MNYKEQLSNWFDKYLDKHRAGELSFDKLPDNEKFHVCEQVSAILFLASKLNVENKTENSFFHGEKEKVDIGRSFDVFETFTENDVKILAAHDICIAEDGDGFEMYARM